MKERLNIKIDSSKKDLIKRVSDYTEGEYGLSRYTLKALDEKIARDKEAGRIPDSVLSA